MGVDGGVSVRADYDFKTDKLWCRHTHHDFEHGHETWAEIMEVVP